MACGSCGGSAARTASASASEPGGTVVRIYQVTEPDGTVSSFTGATAESEAKALVEKQGGRIRLKTGIVSS